MITWMQKHKKYLIITIWISTIAFVGAGFVGWGQYNYSDKAGNVAKVGSVEITMGELQKTYSNLYGQYNEMFQGKFDEEQAKSLGLQKQALQQLTDQALITNLALSYNLAVSDAELLTELKTQEYFFKDGAFSKVIYKQVLKRNNMSVKEYEQDVKKQLLIQKTMKLLSVVTTKNEKNIIDTIMNISDKINYKLLDDSQIDIKVTDATLKPYWESKKQNFMTGVSYDVEYIKQVRVSKQHDEAKIAEYYKANKTRFKDVEGKLLPLEGAREAVVIKLNDKATKDLALRSYIAYKKDKLASDVERTTTTISNANNPYGKEVVEQLSKLSLTLPYLKPIIADDEYYTFKLLKTNTSQVKSFEQARAEITSSFLKDEKKAKLLKLAQDSIATFNGTTTEFITNTDADKLTDMKPAQAQEFIVALFNSKKKRDFIVLNGGEIVLYNILEQKLLNNTNTNTNDTIARLKSALFNDGLIKNLRNKYKTEIYIEGI